MKKLILFILVFSIHVTYVSAKDTDSKEKCDGNAIPLPEKEEGVSTIKDITKKVEEKGLKLLAMQICTRLGGLKGDKKAGEKIENSILKYLKITRAEKDYKIKVSNFWNQNSHKLICNHKYDNLRTPQHFMKRVVDLRMYDNIFYDFLLYDEEEYPIDVNIIEVYNGKKETVLDYLDNILADPKNSKKYDFVEIKQLRRVLKNIYGAKKATEI